MTNEELQASLAQALKDIQALKDQLNKSMTIFSDTIILTKELQINGPGKLRLRNLSSNPTSGVVGELVVVGGKLKICTATTPTWTTVGTQT